MFRINRWHLNLLLCHCFLHAATTEAEAFIYRVTSSPVPCWHQYVSCVISHLAINYLHLTLICMQSNLGSRTPRIMNSSVYEQIFRTQSVSDDVLCLELRTRKPST